MIGRLLQVAFPLLILTVHSCNPVRLETKVGAMEHFQRGVQYQESKQYRLALAEYDAALALDSDQPIIHYNVGLIYYALHLFERSIRSYRRAIGLNPHFAEAWYNLSLAYYQIGDTDAAFMASERYAKLGSEKIEKVERQDEN